MVASLVLTNFAAIDNDISTQMSAGSQKAMQLAMKYGGVRTKFYSQGNTVVGAKKYYSQMGDRTWGGVCFSMTLHWIAMHANDIDFWGWLDANAGGSVLANLQIIATQWDYWYKGKSGANARAAMSDSQFARQFLGQTKYKVIPKKSISAGVHLTRINSDLGKFPDTARGKVIADGLQGASGGAYYNIGIYSPGGHAIGAWVSFQDALFFDPNYGEFWFDKASRFRDWFAEFYTDVTSYKKYTKLDLEVYGKSAF